MTLETLIKSSALDSSRFLSEKPESLDFIWEGGPIAGMVGALVGTGGVGKSFFALEASVAIAAAGEKSADLLGLNPTKEGGVHYYYLEDPERILHQRIYDICKNLDAQAREKVKRNMVVCPLYGNASFDFRDNLALVDEVIRLSKGARLIVLDSLSRSHSYDENSNAEMLLLIEDLERITKETGAALLFLHHTSKYYTINNRLADQRAARGASVIIDSLKWSSFVQSMTEKESEAFTGVNPDLYVRYGVNKYDFYDREPDDIWLERTEGGVLKKVDLTRKVKKRYGAKRGYANY